MLEPVPWMVGGGAVHTPEVGRVLARVASVGAMGILESPDLEVLATGTPSNQVRILPGIGIMPNRYPGGGQQSYIGRNASETLLDVPATDSSGGKSWMVILRVDDPQYGGQTPADPTIGPYQRFALVSCSSTATQLPVGTAYPYVPLARIDMPASTATITQGMVVPVRKMANPRTLEVLRIHATLPGDAGLTLSSKSVDGEWFPNAGGNQDIEIPEWAVRVQIEAFWLNMPVAAGGNPWGSMWVEFGPYVAPSRERRTQYFSYDTNASSNNQRVDWHVADDLYVPANYRGTTQGFTMYANMDPGYTGSVKPSLDGRSGTIMRVKFLEQADPSTS